MPSPIALFPEVGGGGGGGGGGGIVSTVACACNITAQSFRCTEQ